MELNPLEAKSSITAPAASANKKKADGYSNTEYLEQIATTLTATQPAWKRALSKGRSRSRQLKSLGDPAKSGSKSLPLSLPRTRASGSASSKPKPVRRREAFSQL